MAPRKKKLNSIKKSKKLIKLSRTQHNKNHESKESKESIIIKYSSHRFKTHVKTARRVKREPVVEDKFAQYLDDNYKSLVDGKILENRVLDNHLFNHSPDKCICQNMLKMHIDETKCECKNMKTFSSQGKSSAVIHSITCGKEKQILKVVPLDSYYIKLRTQTKKYTFLELDRFSIQTLINKYVHQQLPNNCINMISSGVCNKKVIFNNLYGYNLMDEANMGSGTQFINNLLSKVLDIELEIFDEDSRYLALVNFLLQSVFIIGHLQSSSLEFFHGDYKPENVFITKSNKKTNKYFEFNIFGKKVKVKNMGFAVVIADFDRSSITVDSEDFQNTKYRIISPILFSPLLTSYVNDMIGKYGDVDPDDYDGIVKINKMAISRIIPKSMDPSITVMRSAGVKLFRDMDLYTFFIRLMSNQTVRDYCISRRINETIMSFMSKKFLKELFKTKANNISLNESAYIAIDIMNRVKEPMYPIFNDDYIDTLDNLNYKLFRNYY
jgi:hypothetical protein